jgi:MFS family permease
MNFLMTATPLAMGFCGHPYEAAAGVIAAHVVGMFGPSFFTGSLIARFGVLNVILAGVAIMFGCIGIALSGQAVSDFWWALMLLGIGWNFMYIGGSTLLTEAYRPSERAKVQGLNEITIFTVQALSSFSSGVLVNTHGWTRQLRGFAARALRRAFGSLVGVAAARGAAFLGLPFAAALRSAAP